MAQPMDMVLETLRKHDPSGDGTIGNDELLRLLSLLDTSGYWDAEKVETILQTAGADATTGRVKLEALIHSLYDDSNTFGAVRAELLRIMDSPEWDDGSYAPILIRLGWHSSGTYDKADGSGGSNGATMRYDLEASDPENGGLQQARAFLESVKAKFPWISYSDLWILAAYVALEHTGGPVIPFTGGRKDGDESQAIAPGRLPGAERGLAPGMDLDEEGRLKGWENLAQHVRDVFGRMGFNDQETVALITGGHVYGRCHTGSSGYAGAWVENPTRFSNEYALDMIGDKWMAVTHDTKMPDGGPVPEEVRPAVGKRQYIDLTKYMPEEGEKEAREAPDCAAYPPGRYRCLSQWVNVRDQPDVESSIIGRVSQDQMLTLVSVKVFGTAVRGLAERGGYVSIVGSSGKLLFQREGDIDGQPLRGRYRATAAGGALYFASKEDVSATAPAGRLSAGDEFCVGEVVGDAGEPGVIIGKRADPGPGQDAWVLLFSPEQGLACELVVQGYNEKPRKAIVGQTGHQMMLVSDMVLVWDEEFKKHLEVYAEDEGKLKADFGKAFRRLTELGCPWSADRGGGGPAAASAGLGCPVLAAAA